MAKGMKGGGSCVVKNTKPSGSGGSVKKGSGKNGAAIRGTGFKGTY
jgi:hypothetical protein